MIKRDFYLNQVIAAKDTDFIKIITGIRRCGKSTLLKLFKEYLLANGVAENNIVEINYEKFQFDKLRDGKELHAYIESKLKGQTGKGYLLLDEVQEIDNWPKVINSIRVSFDVDVYVTGSNSRVFAGEQLTYISGRYIEIKVYPLSFSEFMLFRGYDNAHKQKALQEYMRIGSFPAVALANQSALANAVIAGLFDSIFSRDILLRGKIRDEGAFYKVTKFVLDNIGNNISANVIANTLKSQGHKISVDTVDNYLTLMCNAFLLYQCERYNLRGKERLRTNGKYYVTDIGLRNHLLGYRSSDLGHVIENIVFFELKRRGYEVTTGKYDDLEVDFIGTRQEEKLYIQVSLSVMDENVLQREVKPFRMIDDKYPKILITTDDFDLSDDFFDHVNLYDFLLEVK